MTVPIEIQSFRLAAERYCVWAEAPPGRPEDELYWAMRHVADLYSGALSMPSADFAENVPGRFVDKNEYVAVYERFKHLPFQHYGEVFDTTQVPPEEPTVGDIAEDLLDIYTDVKAGLLHYASGEVFQAAWQWKFTWGVHWGRHATSALRAMHCFSTSVSAKEE